MERPLQTVVETAEFLARSSKLMSDEQRARVVEMLARDPECGEIMRGTGGVRKVRVALAGRGKSGGARVIYYFHSEKLPPIRFDCVREERKRKPGTGGTKRDGLGCQGHQASV